MSNLTCLNCSVKFQNADMQRDHYKTDWHRYNLKRKIAQLPPVSVEGFEKLLLEQRSAEKCALEDKSLYCKACSKLFKTINAHDNHLNSKKHKDALKKFVENGDEGEVTVKATGVSKYEQMKRDEYWAKQNEEADDDDDDDIETVDSDEWDEDTENPIANNDCLFCDHHSKSLVKNLSHMSLEHSFFVPDAEFCEDLVGLLSYLAEKIFNDFICIWCNDRGKTFYTADGARKHMRDKGHCRMLFEGAALFEYENFYNYATSFPDHVEGMDIDEELPVELTGNEKKLSDEAEYELVLPSGVTIGHRSLLRYYKQRLNPERAVVIKKQDRRLHKVLAQYRSLGWTETQQKMAARNARDIHAMKRYQAKLMQQVGVKANKLQKHFRAQIL